MTTQEKIAELNKIAEDIKAFKGLDIARAARNAVPGEGNPDAELFFIGEAPGHLENTTGRPFVGQSGQMMRKTLTETTSIMPEQVFITNIVKYRPPENRDPLPEEIEACRDWLDRQIQIIKPTFIVTLGRFSMGKFLTNVTISQVHGEPRHIDFLGSRYTLFPMFHPAAALRGTGMMQQFKADFVKLKNLLTNSIPSTPSVPSQPSNIQASLF